MKRKPGFIVGIVGVLLGVAFLMCAGLMFPLEFVFWTAFGWIPFLYRTLPEITVNWTSVGTAAVAFVVLAVGVHWLAVSYCGKSASDAVESPPRLWRVKWTAGLVAIVIVMFVAGISVIGMTHQFVWLVASGKPVLKNDFSDGMDRGVSRNNLHQIGLAALNYHEQFDRFPPGGSIHAGGSMLHSWETALLPYLEQTLLASQIKHDVPWDAPENETYFQQPVDVFLHRSVTRESGETGRFDERGFALSHYAANGWVLGAGTSFTIKEITDGTSNTIMAGEVRENFKPWGDPSNFRDPMLGINKSPNGFGGPYRNSYGAQFLLVDGSVRFISDKVDPNVLKALSTPAGGETVSEY